MVAFLTFISNIETKNIKEALKDVGEFHAIVTLSVRVEQGLTPST